MDPALLTVLMHGEMGSADEILLIALSVVIGVSLAYFLGLSNKKP